MKTVRLPKEIEPFLEAAKNADGETLVFIEKRRPVAALVCLRKIDREALSLSTNPDFLKIVEAARKEIREGKTVSLEDIERKYQGVTTKKTLPRRRKRRR